jgi:hypothetical protein
LGGARCARRFLAARPVDQVLTGWLGSAHDCEKAWSRTRDFALCARCDNLDRKGPFAKGGDMTTTLLNRRMLLAAGGSMLATGVSGLLMPAQAQTLAPTRSMSGGANNYRKGAPIVERIGRGGFWMSGTVRRAGDGAPLAGQRIQIWAHTTEGYEDNVKSHGATVTDAKGVFRLEMPQIVPAFGQPHGHLAYDSGDFKTVFLRPVMQSAKMTSLEAHFVLEPA